MDKTSIKSHIVFAAQLPPPLNGSANISERVLHLIKENDFSFQFVNMRGRGKKLSYFFSRMGKSIKACSLLIGNYSRRRSTIYYISVSDGWGMLFEMIPWVLASVLAAKRIMHHHSFKYCYRRTFLMYLMQAGGKKNIVNIMLCDFHKQSFFSIYKKSLIPSNIKVIGNEFILEKCKSIDKAKYQEKITIGHLSNLTVAKGLKIVIQIFEFFKNDKKVVFEIAGPAMSVEVKDQLSKYMKEYPDNFKYRGPLYGEAKDDWYKGIDIFLFPTAYNAETYPLVILEAISNKIIPFTTPIGCLCEMNNSLFISDYSDYYDKAVDFIKRYAVDVEFQKICSSAISEMEIKLKNNVIESKDVLLLQLRSLSL
ncbi:MAG: glycosyltransferase family 1 protein [Segetibacter sp.]|nr:glycosyltransferase family 1 protein [Segetibacter sp.]